MTTVKVDLAYQPESMFDGDYETFGHGEEMDHPNGFNITVYLRLTYRISRIRVINRPNCCMDRAIDFTVFIVEQNGKEINCGTITEAKLEYEFWCGGVGCKVELRKGGLVREVNLAEIEIYGTPGETGNWLIKLKVVEPCLEAFKI